MNEMQKVEVYIDLLQAKNCMEYYISCGWRVHTCVAGCYMVEREERKDSILVVYEKANNNSHSDAFKKIEDCGKNKEDAILPEHFYGRKFGNRSVQCV